MSYRHAWLLLESLKRSFREPVTEIYAGGKGGRSMLVTEFGGALIKSYRELERAFATLAARRLHAISQRVSGIPSLTLRLRYARRLSNPLFSITFFYQEENRGGNIDSQPSH